MSRIVFIIILLMSSTFLYANIIYLKDGRFFEGEITQETDKMIVLKEDVDGDSFIESSYKKSDIQRIEKSGSKEKKTKKLSTRPNYSIVEEQDISMKALTKPLSSYTTRELAELPVKKRMKYGILVVPNLAKEEYEKIFRKIISDITTKDNDIDEISLLVYDNKYVLDSFYNVAHVEWCPQGQWDKITPYIASSNDRTGYEITVDWSQEYESKFDGILKAIEREKEGYIKARTPSEFISTFSFDPNSGSLLIIDYLTTGYGANTKWATNYTEHSILQRAGICLECFPYTFPEVKKYEYRLIWKSNEVFRLITNREELDTVSIDKIFTEFEEEAMRQDDLYGYDMDREKNWNWNCIYTKSLETFKI